MGQALYRKYRSKSLAEIVGQEHITETLKRAIETGRVSHAYLFTGPRGVGKTSIARILAHELNNVPYSGEDNHLDIIEIDAASSGGVEEIRDLREKVFIAPSSGKYKVYIIDEVHMMTSAAFNALLKTLEEPPAHTVFILATTEAHKLPATIISRTQRFTFKPIPNDKAVAHLRHIATEEKIDITDEAIALIAEHGGGSFRDSISMLDQASSTSGRIDRESIEKLLGIPPASITANLIKLVAGHDTSGIVQLLASLRSDGYQAAGIAKQLGEALRVHLLTGSTAIEQHRIIALLSRLIEVPASYNPDQLLELILLDAAIADAGATAAQTKIPVEPAATASAPPAAAKKEPEPVSKPAEKVVAPDAETAPVPATEEPQTPEPANPEAGLTIDATVWQALLTALKKQYNTLYGIVRMARPEFTPGRVSLTFGFAFHQKRANDAKNKKILTSILEEITGQRIAIDCHYDKNVTPPAPAAPEPALSNEQVDAGSPLGAISNIFGGGELLKS